MKMIHIKYIISEKHIFEKEAMICYLKGEVELGAIKWEMRMGWQDGKDCTSLHKTWVAFSD